MMAFAFFLLWVVASLALLAIWVFRESPPATGNASAALSSVASASAVEG